jgi:N-acetylglucosaminyl-diphospho-decaprenol L-rhamnosyltransferase
MKPDLSIVIVSWNVRALLADCLESIRTGDGLSVEVIVVDSDSGDGTPDMVRDRFPAVQLVEPGSNVGFTKGNNIGIQASQGRFVLLLNPDTRVLGGALEKMVGYMDDHEKDGALGPQLLNDDMTVQSSRRRFPTLKTAFFESTWLQPYAPRKVLDDYYMRDHQDDRISPVDWVQGAALLVRREVIEQVGPMDEGFFMYSEELDWQRRIKAAGWEIVYYPEAQIVHYGGKSSEQVTAERDIYFHSSKIRYFRKHHGAGVALLLRVFLLGNYVWQLGLEAGKWLLGHKRELRRARIHAYWLVLRSGLKE